MSDHSDEELDGLVFDDRTTKDKFNEKLLKAKESNADDDVGDRINFNEFLMSDDNDHLKKQLNLLQSQVNHMENQVNDMEVKLATRRERRAKEASLTNLSPEERAEHVIRQEEEAHEDDTPDLDVIFEYLLLLGSTPSNDANDLSQSDFIKPHAGLRKKALEDESVLRQTKYSSLHFTEANNVLESNMDGEGEIRHCELIGTSYNEKFQLTFDVLEPAMTMSNLIFDVDIEMHLEIGDVLEKVKEECNILAFFKVLGHYGLLAKQRDEIFEKLIKKYEHSNVNVEMLSQSRLQFEGGSVSDLNLILEWRTRTVNTDKYRLDANVTDHIQPEISLEAVAQPLVTEKDTFNVLDQINEHFLMLVKLRGVYNATETVINKIFTPEDVSSVGESIS